MSERGDSFTLVLGSSQFLQPHPLPDNCHLPLHHSVCVSVCVCVCVCVRFYTFVCVLYVGVCPMCVICSVCMCVIVCVHKGHIEEICWEPAQCELSAGENKKSLQHS